METDNYVNKSDFMAFCDEHYPPGVLSKTMRTERRDRIAGWLQGIYPPPRGNWRYRVINRGYNLVDFPDLGLKEVLCLKAAEKNGQIEKGMYGEWRKVVSVEEYYDILLNTHVRVLNHGGYRALMKALEKDFTGITRAAIIKFVSMCSVCCKNPRQQSRSHHSAGQKIVQLGSITREFNRRCQIDMIDMTQCPDGLSTYIGLYTDHWTKFVTLFPMVGCTAEHMAYGLAASVYPYYGPPHFLHSGDGKEFAARVVALSIEKWKGGERTVVPRAKEALMYMRETVARTKELLIQLLNARAAREKVEGSLPWGTWLNRIMYDINNQQSGSTAQSPYKRVFDRAVVSTSGESSSSTPEQSTSSGGSTAGSGAKRKRRSSSDDNSAVITTYKTPGPTGVPRRPNTFVAIDNKR
ncbi:SCAN domain-containing protein 3-like [Babylonia areolata]|uniref:SCAN domain-containing protein 3-like n=1 Tax=Babylonia areolata TaxID=304850 RepID=UPI003FCF2225